MNDAPSTLDLVKAIVVPGRRRKLVEHADWHVVASVRQWNDPEVLERYGVLGLQADQIVREVLPDVERAWAEGNLLTNGAGTGGINRLLNLLIAGGGQAFDATHTRLGAGDGSTAAAITDTDLSAAAGATHRYFQPADATYPSVATNVLSVLATFGTANGNFAWNEWGIDQGTAGGTTVVAPLLNRKVPASTLGTKGSGATWALSVTITIS